MFTGIIETLAEVTRLEKEDTNLHITLKSDITQELKIDQSLAHNGVCLTVVAIDGDEYTVTAIKETIDKSNIGDLKVNDWVNLERAMKLGARLDGHIVQGHVDTTGVCTNIVDENGSTVYTFNYTDNPEHITIEKGSITVNGVSLTVVNSQKTGFSVAIIPYTKAHTTFQSLKVGDRINLEFDVIGKYVARLTQL